MANGLPLVDTHQQMRVSPEFKAPANNFTSFSGDMLRDVQNSITNPPERGAVTATEVPQFSNWDEADIKRFMKNLETQGTLPQKKEIVNEVKNKIPQEVKNPQGFWARIWEKIKKFFNPWS